MPLRFQPIDLNRHSDLCLSFRRDSYFCSYGEGDDIHAYVVALFERHWLPSARLSVSPTNVRALRYYAKNGWRDIGPRPDHPRVNLMELTLSSRR